MKMLYLLLVMVALSPLNVFASVQMFSSTGAAIGHFDKLKCVGFSCAQSSGKLNISPAVGDGATAQYGYLQNIVSVSGDLTVSQCGSTIVSALANDFYNLPDISGSSALGCRFTFVVGVAGGGGANVGLKIDTKTSGEQIVLLTNATGDSITADAVGESVVLQAVKSGVNPVWAPVGKEQGTWTDSN